MKPHYITAIVCTLAAAATFGLNGCASLAPASQKDAATSRATLMASKSSDFGIRRNTFTVSVNIDIAVARIHRYAQACIPGRVRNISTTMPENSLRFASAEKTGKTTGQFTYRYQTNGGDIFEGKDGTVLTGADLLAVGPNKTQITVVSRDILWGKDGFVEALEGWAKDSKTCHDIFGGWGDYRAKAL